MVSRIGRKFAARPQPPVSVTHRALAIPELLELIFQRSDARMCQDFQSWRLVSKSWRAALIKVAVRGATISALHSPAGRLQNRQTNMPLEPSAPANAGG